MESEVLVTISLRFPVMDRPALSAHLTALVAEAISVGGITTHIGFQPYEPEDDDGE